MEQFKHTVSPSTGSILTSDGDSITLESGDTPLEHQALHTLVTEPFHSMKLYL